MTQLTGNGPAFTGQGSVGALFNNPLTNPITSNPRISFSHLNNQTQSISDIQPNSWVSPTGFIGSQMPFQSGLQGNTFVNPNQAICGLTGLTGGLTGNMTNPQFGGLNSVSTTLPTGQINAISAAQAAVQAAQFAAQAAASVATNPQAAAQAAVAANQAAQTAATVACLVNPMALNVVNPQLNPQLNSALVSNGLPVQIGTPVQLSGQPVQFNMTPHGDLNNAAFGFAHQAHPFSNIMGSPWAQLQNQAAQAAQLQSLALAAVQGQQLAGQSIVDFSAIAQAQQCDGFVPGITVSENQQEVRVIAELPSVDEKNTEVVFKNGVLTIRGEKRPSEEERRDHLQSNDRQFGRFNRAIVLGDVLSSIIDESKISAKFDNRGVLNITMPKRRQSSGAFTRVNVGNK